MADILESLAISEVRSREALERLEAEWSGLWQRCPEATPFQHPNWLIAWWKHFGGDKQLFTLTLHDNGVLVGIAPLCVLQDGDGRKMMMLGVGTSDCLDALFAPGYERLGAEAVLAQIALAAPIWDVCDLQPLLRTSPLLAVPEPDGITNVLEKIDTLTALELPSDATVFRQGLSRHFCDRYKEATRRAGTLGAVRFQTATRHSFDNTFDHLLRLHEARWGGQNREARAARLFQREAASAMLDRGALRLYSLEIDGRVVAVLFGFFHQRRGYFYMMGFDREFGKISPGVLLMMYGINELIREGAKTCEFLRGREAYKQRWSVLERPTYSRRLQHSQ